MWETDTCNVYGVESLVLTAQGLPHTADVTELDIFGKFSSSVFCCLWNKPPGNKIQPAANSSLLYKSLAVLAEATSMFSLIFRKPWLQNWGSPRTTNHMWAVWPWHTDLFIIDDMSGLCVQTEHVGNATLKKWTHCSGPKVTGQCSQQSYEDKNRQQVDAVYGWTGKYIAEGQRYKSVITVICDNNDL